MGFLDFLKKQPPRPSQPPLPPKPVAQTSFNQDSLDKISKDFYSQELPDKDMGPPKVDPFGLEAISPETPANADTPSDFDLDEIKRKLGIEDEDDEVSSVVESKTPVMASTTILPPVPVETSQPELPVQKSAPAKMPDLPDFNDEDIMALERSISATKKSLPVRAQESETPSPIEKDHQMIKYAPRETQTKNPVAQMVQRREAPELPPMAHKSSAHEASPLHPSISIEKAMFMSADEYSVVSEEIKALRKTLRRNDDTLREAQLRHEQADEQMARAASDTNSLQERLMSLDKALFEE